MHIEELMSKRVKLEDPYFLCLIDGDCVTTLSVSHYWYLWVLSTVVSVRLQIDPFTTLKELITSQNEYLALLTGTKSLNRITVERNPYIGFVYCLYTVTLEFATNNHVKLGRTDHLNNVPPFRKFPFFLFLFRHLRLLHFNLYTGSSLLFWGVWGPTSFPLKFLHPS